MAAGAGGLDVANVFKPALARGELNLIGATTRGEYQKYVEKGAALERRFQPVLVSEPSVEQTIMILHGLRDTLEAHHKVTITEEAIVAAAELSDRNVTGRFLPDKAIDLADQAAARLRISASAGPVEVQELDAEVRQLKREEDDATSRKQFDRAKEIEARQQVRGKVVDFTNTILIATSNLGADIIQRTLRERRDTGAAPDSAALKREVMEVLRGQFRPEFINRIDEIIPKFGARKLRRLIRSELETRLARAVLAGEVHEGDAVLARWDGGQQSVVLEPQPRPETEPAAAPGNTAKRARGSAGAAKAADASRAA